MKLKDLELGKLFVATEPYSKHEDFYMKIQCSYEGSNAVRLRDGIAIQFNAFTDVTEIEFDLVEYLNDMYADVIEFAKKMLDRIKEARAEIKNLDGTTDDYTCGAEVVFRNMVDVKEVLEILDKLIAEVEG